MAVVERTGLGASKRQIVYGAMLVAGAVFVSTVILPLSAPLAQLLAVLAFGVMSGRWLAHLVCSP